MATPLVSVLSPSFNQAQWLGDNLNSVAAQRYPQIEHIVMDGGSSDGSVELLRAAGASIHWRSEPDRGQSHAINKAFAVSSGEIIGWLNSDDAYFDGNAVAAAVRTFQLYPEVDLVYGHAALVNADGLVLQLLWTPPYSHRLLRMYNFIAQPAAFIRRSALTNVFADESFDYAMDRELWLRLAGSHKAKRVNRILAIDRHHLARKCYTRLDLAAMDGEKLAQMYGIPVQGIWHKSREKALKIGMRIAGTPLIAAASGPTVFNGASDGRWALLHRQVAVKRRAMPLGAQQSLRVPK